MDVMSQLVMLSPSVQGSLQLPLAFRQIKQWSDLRNALVNLGNDVIVIPKTDELMCPSIARAALIVGDLVIPGRFTGQDSSEEGFFMNWFVKHHYRPALVEEMVRFGGSRDAIFNANHTILWYGIGPSHFSFKKVLDLLLDESQIVVRGLEIVDSRFRSLDSCFCPLSNGYILWYPEAFSEHSRGVVEAWYSERTIAVSEEDAIALACSAISQHHMIVIPNVSFELINQLNNIGYVVTTIDMSEFTKNGIGCKALVLETNE